jgi:hypothetical protein
LSAFQLVITAETLTSRVIRRSHEKDNGLEEVHVPAGAWLLIGIGCAVLLGTLLLVLILPSERRGRPPRFATPRLKLPSLTIPSGSPAGSLLKGFSYLYAPLGYPHIRRNVAGRLGDAIARIDAVDPSPVPERVSQAMQQTAELIDPEELPPPGDGEPVINLFDQARRREEARRKEQA